MDNHKSKNKSNNANLWFERLMAIISMANLSLVIFDLSYIPWRNLYFNHLPELTKKYDLIKGIEPHRDTQKYLATVDDLQTSIELSGLDFPEVKNRLYQLQKLSVEMINNNPFAGVGKAGTLEKIKKNIRERIAVVTNGRKISSSKEAFKIFWSYDYLSSKGWGKENLFFNQKIQPLIASNYFRHIDDNGEFIDLFWMIDLPFIVLFSLEFIILSLWLKHKHPNFSYLRLVLWHWYNLWLIFPLWRWMRILPVIFRLERADFLHVNQLRRQIQQLIVASFAEEITEMVIVRVINQTQTSISKGELTRWLLQRDNWFSYVDVNNMNEIEAIIEIFVQVLIYQIIPQIKPEIDAILQHAIHITLNQTPFYQNFKNFPGVEAIQTQLGQELVNHITTNLYQFLASGCKDPVSTELSSKLMESFTKVLGSEMQKKNILSEVQNLFIDFLEEVKINYVQQLSEEEIEEILERTSHLKTQTSVRHFFNSNNSLTS